MAQSVGCRYNRRVEKEVEHPMGWFFLGGGTGGRCTWAQLVRAGLLVMALALITVFVPPFTFCRVDSPGCSRLASVLTVIDAPERLLSRTAIRYLGRVLGVRQLNPDLVVAPAGVPQFLALTRWIFFGIYWFLVGIFIRTVSARALFFFSRVGAKPKA